MILKVLIGLVVVYGLALIAGYSLQRRLLYVVDPRRVTPVEAGLRGVVEVQIDAPDGARIVAWHAKSQTGRPTLLYFHGNGGSLADRSLRFERFMSEGWGVFMMTYRGYGGSTGAPNQEDNIADAVRAYDTLAGSGVAARDVVLYGESLGTGVASRVALQRPAAGLILDAPFTSIPDVAKRQFWYAPVRLIMRDRYETARIIDRINMPLLVMHGARDATVPVEMGRELARLAKEPKTLAILPNGGHSDLYTNGNSGLDVVRTFIAKLNR